MQPREASVSHQLDEEDTVGDVGGDNLVEGDGDMGDDDDVGTDGDNEEGAVGADGVRMRRDEGEALLHGNDENIVTAPQVHLMVHLGEDEDTRTLPLLQRIRFGGTDVLD